MVNSASALCSSLACHKITAAIGSSPHPQSVAAAPLTPTGVNSFGGSQRSLGGSYLASPGNSNGFLPSASASHLVQQQQHSPLAVSAHAPSPSSANNGSFRNYKVLILIS